MHYLVPLATDKRYIVTGANSGTGREAARRLAHSGAMVILAVRSLDKGENAAADIRREARPPDSTYAGWTWPIFPRSTSWPPAS